MKRRIDSLIKKMTRVVVGIETGNTPGRLGAAVVGVSGKGDETVLDLFGFRNYSLPRELLATLKALENDGEFDSEEVAGIDFLIHHHLSNLYQEVLDEVDILQDEIDLIGLKCIEVGGKMFPKDPSVLSEMTNRIVVSRFSIGYENGEGSFLPVKEPLLQRMVEAMVDKFDLQSEEREAVAVALLANESLFHESSETCIGEEAGSRRSRRPSLKAVKRSVKSVGNEKACLCGEFFFPD